MTPVYITTGAAARILKCSRGRVRRLVVAGNLRARRLPGSAQYDVLASDVRELAARVDAERAARTDPTDRTDRTQT